MLIFTDRKAVDAAHEANAPRPISEPTGTSYAGATQDAQGRFHAPYDGYECELTGRVFRAGEYLPVEESDHGVETSLPREKDGELNYPKAVCLKTGEIVKWEGQTFKQRMAVWDELFEQTRAHEASISEHVGEIGKRMKLEGLRVKFAKTFSGYYGPSNLFVMTNASGSVVIYKGSANLTDQNGDKATEGSEVTLTATIAEHGYRDGVKQTVIKRPKQ